MGRLFVLWVALVASTSHASGLEEALADGVVVDWRRGVVIATGAAPADLRAPSPTVARTKASRRARTQARERLSAAVAQVPRAAGLRVNKGTSAALRRAVAEASVVDEVLGSDGSSMVTLAVGIEAIRAALVGPLPPTRGDVATLVVDARGIDLSPAVGLSVRVGKTRYSGPTLYSQVLVTKKATQGANKVLRTKAISSKRGVVELSGISAAELGVAASSNPLVLFVIKTRKGRR